MSKTRRRKDDAQKGKRSRRARIERRDALENPAIPLDAKAWAEIFDDVVGSHAGESVTPKKALSLAPVFQAVEMLSGDLAKIPLALYKRTDGPLGEGTGKTRDPQHPAYGLVHLSGSPNDETAAFEFWRRMYAHALIWGNAYAMIERDERKRPVALFNLLPDRTEPFYSKNTGKLWYVTEIDGKEEPLRFEEVLHLRRFGVDNLQGIALLAAARQVLGKALAAAKFESKFFSNNATLGGILHVPPGATAPSVRTVEEGIEQKYRSADKAFKTLVLRDGYRFEKIQASPKEAMLDTLDERSARDAARFFNIPPSRLGLKDSVSYGSAEADRRFYHDSTLSPWLFAAAGECGLKLLAPNERRAGAFFEHVADALLWADAAQRATIYSTLIQAGVLCPDEVRAAENRPPRPDGEGGVYVRPMNMTPAADPAGGEASGGEAKPANEPPPKPPGEEPPAEDDGEDRSASRSVALAWFRDAYGRARRRLDNVVSRAKPEERQALAAELDAKHREALDEILLASQRAANGCGALNVWSAPQELLDVYRRHLAESTDLAAELAQLERLWKLPQEQRS